MRVAAVDLGSNSTRLLVADVDGTRVDEVLRRSVVTRLGEGVDARRRLLPLPVARVRNVLVEFRRELEELGATRTLAVGTSAIRDAENGEAFLGEIEWSYGFATRLLTGTEEAALTRAGIGTVARAALVLDVGGGSTELITADRAVSLDVGSVRLTERFLESDPPTSGELGRAADEVWALLPELAVHDAVGVGGTVAQLTGLARTCTLTRTRVEALCEQLAGMRLVERRRLEGIDPARAPVIVAGALIVREALRRYGLEHIRFSPHDLLDGAARAAAQLPPPQERPAPPGAFPCC